VTGGVHDAPFVAEAGGSRLAAEVRITEFTDPVCPWAYSAEPFRLKLAWSYGEQLAWETRMVVLAEDPSDYRRRGFTPEKQAASLKRIAREHRMPMDPTRRPRMAATLPACRAVVGARLHAPDRMRFLLRRLRIRHFSMQLLDEPGTIEGAAEDAGIEHAELRRWLDDPGVEQEVRADMAAAREPTAAARALDHKLAGWAGGRRYTCPSYELVGVSEGRRLSVPGFQPFAGYDVAMANLAPELERRPPPETVEEALRWAAMPLATQEVAVLCELSFEEARARLARVAEQRRLGDDGFWTIP
jgi:predicted DsbA family dithiol-disulfide isomerase